MIERIWVKNYRMLAHNRVDLMPFAVLVGRNATGKTTLMAAIRFISNSLSLGVQAAVDLATDNAGAGFTDLCFHAHEPLQFAVEIRLIHGLYRYELEVACGSSREPVVSRENLFRLPESALARTLQPSLFADEDFEEVIHNQAPRNQRWRRVAGKTAEGKDYFQDEKTDWNNTFRFGPNRPALGSLPEDSERFPGAIAVRNLLREGVILVELDSHALRMPSPPRSEHHLVRDGSNLAAAAAALQTQNPEAFRQWVEHVRDAIEGLVAVTTWERPEDRNLVLQAIFAGSHDTPVPSWLLSDGTLRLMALSFLSFSEREDQAGIYLIEEPENGLHPLAIQSVHSALSTMSTMQVFVATHSPVFLANTSLDQALVFSRTDYGTARVQRGREVAQLRSWQEQVALADVFTTGVL
jgi:predicted ATPase